MNRPNLFIGEYDFIAASGCSPVIGIDEAGRGPLAGPVVAAAAVVRGNDLFARHKANTACWCAPLCTLVRDSKTLSEKQRAVARQFVQENFFIGVGVCDSAVIDRMNILQATFLAMKKALTQLMRDAKKHDNVPESSRDALLLIDGTMTIPALSYPQRAIERGDGQYASIAAASIIAKTHRDALMQEFHRQYPQYGFDQHKGYGTRAHMAALQKYGPSPIHRRSFAPVRAYLTDLAQVGAE